MPPLHIAGVSYHGGFTHLGETTSRAGRLVLDEDALTLDRIVHETLTKNVDPPIELCRTRAIAYVEVTSEQVARSKVGAAFLFGVLGAVTAKSAEDRATFLVYLKNGEAGYLTVNNHSTASLLGLLTPWLREQGITLGAPEGRSVDAATGPKLIADELAKLAQLRDSGGLSEEEFIALKTQLIQDHTGTAAAD